MKLTQDQISEFIAEMTRSPKGLQELFSMIMNALMKGERKLWQEEQNEAANGFRPRRIRYKGLEFALKVPRTREGGFYPTLLAVLRDEEDEREKLFTELYSNGLTTEQIGKIAERIFSRTYSKQHVSYLVRESTEEVEAWLSRKLSSHYLVLYIDATYVNTRGREEVSREAYYTMLGVLPDGTREVLGIVNHPTEGATNWKTELKSLQERGVEQVDLFVSDALVGIENAVMGAFPSAAHQFCTVHLVREMSSLVSRKEVNALLEEFHDVLAIDSDSATSASQYDLFLTFVERWSKKYPRFKRYNNPRNALYFTYLSYPKAYRRMIYTTNWIERLNRFYKRTLAMRSAMPSADSVLFLLGHVAMEKTMTTYAYPIVIFRDWKNACLRHKQREMASESLSLLS